MSSAAELELSHDLMGRKKKDFPNAAVRCGVSVLEKPCYTTVFSGLRLSLDQVALYEISTSKKLMES